MEEDGFCPLVWKLGMLSGGLLELPGTTGRIYGLNVSNVLGSMVERFTGLTEETAISEAKRCMSCGFCFECDNCVIYCAQDAVTRVNKDERVMGRYVETDYAKWCRVPYLQGGLLHRFHRYGSGPVH